MRTMNEIHKIGMDALIKALGVVDAIKFIQYYDEGSGDYTKERQELFKDVTCNDIMEEIKKNREKS